MTVETDVLVVGAGPVGLLIAIQLARMGIKVHIIDKRDKADPDFPMFGRATTLYPRTCEMLDQLDLYDDMAQKGIVGYGTVNYQNGVKHAGGYEMKQRFYGTFFNAMLNLRLKFSEDIFRRRLRELGVEVLAPHSLTHLEVGDEAGDDHKVRATYVSGKTGKATEVRARYTVGCDGSNSAVRTLAEIPFVGSDTEDNWVRIDGIIETDMPESRLGFGSNVSPTHGVVLWVALDHGTARIGYALTKELYAKYGKNMTQEQAKYEAEQAMKPFSVTFKTVDWYTVYSVKQRVAQIFQQTQRILIAGDAAHQHSSGTAQGMNTGVHDAVCLAWRLGGVLRGWYSGQVLETYDTERRAVAQELIDNDSTSSALISGHKPEKMKNSPLTPAELFNDFQHQISAFSFGVGISYRNNLLNPAETQYPVSIEPGHRVIDTLVQPVGPHLPKIRLLTVCRMNSKFKLILLLGTKDSEACEYLRRVGDASPLAALDTYPSIETIGIAALYRDRVDEYLGFEHWGRLYWDPDIRAHSDLSINPDVGAVLVMRPDGILGYSARINEAGAAAVLKYFEGITGQDDASATANAITNGTVLRA